MKELTYRGFTGSVKASLEDECLIGEVLFIDDHIVFEGQTIPEIKKSFEEAVDHYLDYCKRNNKEPSKPYSGSFNIRVGAELHRAASKEAYKAGVSLNEYVTQCIQSNISGYSTHSQAVATWGMVGAIFPNQGVTQPVSPLMQPQQSTPDTYSHLVSNYIN